MDTFCQRKEKKKMWKIAKGFFLHLLCLMQSASAKCTAFLLVKAVLSFSSLPALELLQRDKVLHGSLTHTVVISQSRLAPCPTKHKLPWSLQLFHGNTTVINTVNNRSNPFHVSPLSPGKDSTAPSPWTCANCWAQRRQWQWSPYPLQELYVRSKGRKGTETLNS